MEQEPDKKVEAASDALKKGEANVDESGDVDLDLLDFLASLSPAERLARHEQARTLVEALRRAGEKLYGVDPRALTTSR